MLVSEILTEVVTEVGADADDTALPTKLLGFAKSALRRFPRFSRNRITQGRVSGTLSAGASTMTLPAGLNMISQVFYEEDGERREIERPKLKEFNSRYRGNSIGNPEYCIVRADADGVQTVEFNVKADKNYTVYFESSIDIDDISASDTWPYSSDRAEILKDGIKWYYYRSIDDDLAGDHKTDFGAGLKELEREFMREEMPDHVQEEQ